MEVRVSMATDASELAQPRRDAVQGQIARKRNRPLLSLRVRWNRRSVRRIRRAGRVQGWLLLLLRFAITRDPQDEAAALAMADEIDALGLRWRPSAPSFFRRTSAEVCWAITAPDGPKRAGVLKSHVARIDQPPLRRAFQAAVELEQEMPAASPKSRRRNLWVGLRR